MLRMANFYLRNGDEDAAAEAAYQLLRRANSSRSTGTDTRLAEQATRMLGKLGRLDKIIEQAEKRVAAAPNSAQLKGELLELYTAAGRKDDASRLIEELSELSPNDPQTLLKTAKQLAGANKPSEAMDKFLEAFKAQPNLMSQHFYDFTNAVRKCKRYDDVYRELTTWDAKQIPSFRYDELLNIQRDYGSAMSDAEIKFADHLLSGVDSSNLGGLIDDLENREGYEKLESVGKAIERIFADQSVYLPNSQIWRSGGWTDDGTFYGALDALMTYIGKNSETQATVMKSMAAFREDESIAPTVDVLESYVVFRSTEKHERLAESLEQNVDGEERRVSAYLVWQIAQSLEDVKPLNELVVQMFEYVRDDPQIGANRRGFDYGLGPKLAGAYQRAGQAEKARALLWEGYESTDHSRDNQSNPGYGDYQDLNAYRSIAKSLRDSGYPLDAVRIYNSTLAEPEKFERALRWGGSRSSREAFEKELTATIDSLEKGKYHEYLKSLIVLEHAGEVDTEQDDGPAASRKPPLFAVEHFCIAPTPSVEARNSSLAAMMLSEIIGSDRGKAIIAEFESQLAGLAEQRPSDFSIRAMQTLVSLLQERPNVGEQIDRLMEQFPKWDDSQKLDAEAPEVKAVLDLYSLALIALESSDTDVAGRGERLVNYLIKLSGAAGAAQHGQTLIAALLERGDSPESRENAQRLYAQMIDAIAPPSDPPRVLPSEKARECLKIAKQAADAGLLDVSIQAARRALGGGPPLRQLQTDGNAFSLPTRSTSTNRQDLRAELADMRDLSAQLAEILAVWQTLDEDGIGTTEAIAAIVMPESRAGEMFSYPVTLVGTNVRLGGESELVAKNAALALAVAAKKSGRLHEIAQQVETLRPRLHQPIVADAMLLLLDLQSGDEQAIERRMKTLLSTAGGKLPPAEKVSRAFVQSSPASRTSEMMVEAETTLTLADHLLQALLPVLKSRQCQEHTDRALLRTVGLIVSDGVAHSYVEEQVGFVAKSLIDRMADRGADELLEQTVGTRLASLEIQYSGYSGNYGEQRVAAESKRICIQLARKRQWDLAAEIARRGPSTSLREAADTRFAANLCLAIDSIKDPDQRYETAAAFTLGVRQDDSDFRDWVSDLRYEVPPPELSDVVKKAGALERLPRWAENVPLTSSALVLLHAAVEANRVDELTTELQKHSKVPGDESDAALGMLFLLQQDIDSAKEKLLAVAKRIAEADPDKVDKQTWEEPVAALGLLAVCIDREIEPDNAVQTMEKLLTLSRKASVNHFTTIVGRELASSGGSVAAGATADVPLKHFVALAYPSSYGQANPSALMPLTSVQDGMAHQVGGFGFHSLMLRYPLEGNFTLTGQMVSLGYGESGLVGDGIAFDVEAWQKKLVARQLASWSGPKYDCTDVEHNKTRPESIEFGEENISFHVKDNQMMQAKRSGGFPFIGVQTTQYRISKIGTLAITGDVKIPGEVRLIEPRLRGWRSLMYGGALPDPWLPVDQDKDPKTITEQRREAAKNESSNCTWYVAEEELRSGNRFSYRGTSNFADLQFMRPILEGETVRYEFFFEPEKQELHPMVGRVAVMLRPDGPKLAWLPVSESIETDGIQPKQEVVPAESLFDGEALPLKANAWNEVELSSAEGRLKFTLNGQPLCEVDTHPNDRFGFVREKGRECRVRNVILTGPWPEELPADLMETK